MDMPTQPDSVVLAKLQGAEEASAAWHALGHESQFSQNLLQLLEADTLLPPQVVEYVSESLVSMWW